MLTDIEAQLEELRSRLYEVTEVDWILNIHMILTEPTCPSVVICPEGYAISRYRFDENTIEAGLEKCIAAVRSEVLDGRVDARWEGAAPWSEGDDANFATWLQTRGAFPEPVEEAD